MKTKHAVYLVVIGLLFALVMFVLAASAAPVERTAPPTPIYVELDAGGRVVILCSGIHEDHLSIRPANRHAVYVDCVRGDIEP